MVGYRSLQNTLKEFDVDMSHFKQQSWSKGKKLSKIPIQDYLDNKVQIQSYKLKLKLIKENLLQWKCADCNISQWQGKYIALELEHVDGNHLNNNLSNLKLLCPNCHAQTATYRGKNKKSKKPVVIEALPKIKIKKITACIDCNKEISLGSQRCKSCTSKLQPTKIIWPSKEELEKLVWETPRSVLAIQFGVSGKAIEKHCNKLQISQPPRGYWAKKQYGKI